MLKNLIPSTGSIDVLKQRAFRLRKHMVVQARGKGQGYLGQSLGTAEFLTALYFNEMRYDPERLDDPDRDRFLLSPGHYALALWAVFAEIGIIAPEILSDYGKDGGPIDMTTLDTVPGVEITGGSLGQGLGQAVGMALGHKIDKRDSRIFIATSDGELQEGSTWEAAMSASSFQLDNLVNLVDCNGIQADGAIVIDIEPVAAKWQAFGWDVTEIDGNDMEHVVNALAGARIRNGRPKAIVMRTKPGKGIPMLEGREKSHFIRVDAAEWDAIERELVEKSYV